MNKIKKTKNRTKIRTETEFESGKESRIKNGSPAERPCANIVSQGTADEQSTAGNIKSVENERAVISIISIIRITTFTPITTRSPNTGVVLSPRGGRHAY